MSAVARRCASVSANGSDASNAARVSSGRASARVGAAARRSWRTPIMASSIVSSSSKASRRRASRWRSAESG